jgi:flagellar biosynthetic protein FlhB
VADSGQRTEKPTQRRLERARREGHFPASREFVSSIQFLGFVALAATFASEWLVGTARLMRRLLRAAFSTSVTPRGTLALLKEMVLPELAPLIAGGLALVALVIFAQLSTTRMGISLAKLAPDFKRLNVLSKLRTLPGQNLPLLVQALLLLPLVGAVVWGEVHENLDALVELAWLAPRPAAARIGATLGTLLWRVAGFFLVVGVVDLSWQRHRYKKQLRMSKQEIREEIKEQEGSPHIKMRIRRIQRDLARRHMMKEISKATAVIVNPTHYAVAIRYSIDSGAAPRVVAKGKNYLAKRIRQKAVEAHIPIVENPPLARALYSSVEVGQEIPSHLYRAVAEILAYIYRLMNGRLPGS